MSRQINIKISKKRLLEVFFIIESNITWIGIRKKIFTSSVSKYSEVNPEMILGTLVKEFKFSSFHVFTYLKKSKECIKELFNRVNKNTLIDLYFPYPPCEKDGKTSIIDDCYWQSMAQTSRELDVDEEHFREYSTKILKQYISSKVTIYDPACSSGTFLSHLSQSYPSSQYIGSDKSKEMVNIARKKIKQVFLNDANNYHIKELYCDVMICRFLNHEIVTDKTAIKIIEGLLNMIKAGGIIVIFGHTPVAFNVIKFAKNNNLRVLNSIGSIQKYSVFQYYILCKGV